MRLELRILAAVGVLVLLILAYVEYVSLPGSSPNSITSFSAWKYTVPGTANAVALTPDGTYLAAGTESGRLSGSIYLFQGKGGSASAGTGHLLWRHDTQTAILSVAISRNGSLIAAAGSQIVGLGGFYSNEMLYALSRDGVVLWNSSVTSPVWAMLVSPDGSRLVVREEDSVVCFGAQSGSIIWQQKVGGSSSVTLSMNDNATVLAVGGSGRAYLLSMTDGHPLWSHSVLSGYSVGPEAISGDGAYVAVGAVKTGTDGSVYLLDGRTGYLLWTHHVNSDVLSASVSHDGSRIAFGTNDWIIFYDRAGTQLWNDTDANAKVLIVPERPASASLSPQSSESVAINESKTTTATTMDTASTGVFAGLWTNIPPSVMLIDGLTGRPVWSASVVTVHSIDIGSEAGLAAVAAGPAEASPSSGGTIYMFSLNKGLG